MPGLRGSEVRRLTNAATIRMDNDLAARCASAASVANLSVAEWLRRLMADAVKLEDKEERRSKPRARLKSRPDELTRALVSLADHLAEFAEILTSISAVQDEGDDARKLSNIWPLVAH